MRPGRPPAGGKRQGGAMSSELEFRRILSAAAKAMPAHPSQGISPAQHNAIIANFIYHAARELASKSPLRDTAVAALDRAESLRLRRTSERLSRMLAATAHHYGEVIAGAPGARALRVPEVAFAMIGPDHSVSVRELPATREILLCYVPYQAETKDAATPSKP